MWLTLSTPWQVGLELAWESYCEGSVPIGAVITKPNGEIVSKGRNRLAGPPSSAGNRITGGRLSHAEINALLGLDYASIDPYSLKLYTTVEPCPLCIGAICMAGIKSVRYAARDAYSGSVNVLHASPYLRSKRIDAFGPENSDLETIVHMIQVAGQLERAHPRMARVLDAWSAVYAEDVRLGRALFESGEMKNMRNRGLPAAEVIDRLSDLMRGWILED